MSCTTNDDPVRPGTRLKSNVLVAAVVEVLMTKTCTPLDDVPAKYSGVLVVGASAVGVKTLAGAPIVESWWKARSSAFVTMAICVLLRRLSCRSAVRSQ